MDYCIYHPPTQRIYFGQVTFPCIDLFFFFFLTILPDIPKKRGKQKLQLQLKFMIRYIRKVKGLWVHLQRKVKAFKGTCLEAHQKQHTSIYRRAFSARGSGDFNFQFLFGYGSGSTWSTASCLRVAKNLVTNCCHSGFKNILNINATQVQVN